MNLNSEYKAEMEMADDLARRAQRRAAKVGVWKTKSGSYIRICDMRTQHIINVIGYIKRNDKKDIMLPWIVEFKKELKKRGVKV